MLMNNPVQFQLKAREWAIMHADAPKITNWSAPSQAPAATKPKEPISAEEEARKQALRYVYG
jgi:ubiquitin-conjugating enzyme (huntingtin interacting protein 2)